MPPEWNDPLRFNALQARHSDALPPMPSVASDLKFAVLVLLVIDLGFIGLVAWWW